jgi:large subunit ribosomal protein L5
MAILDYKKTDAALRQSTGRENVHALPRIKRVVVNAGIGKRVASDGKKIIEDIEKDLARITGQKPAVRSARKSVASFKVREGAPVGLMVTLRGKRAEDFLTRLIRVALPRMRDFRGIKRSAVDSSGNLNIGIPEQTVFPEAAEDPTGINFGFQVTVVSTAENRKEGEEFYRSLGFPLAKAEEEA